MELSKGGEKLGEIWVDGIYITDIVSINVKPRIATEPFDRNAPLRVGMQQEGTLKVVHLSNALKKIMEVANE